MNSHSFCRSLLKSCISDFGAKSRDFTVTKSSLGSYEVQGPDEFYYYSNSACCVWSAKEEAMDYFYGTETTPALSSRESEKSKENKSVDGEKDTAAEIWSLFNQLESIIENLAVGDFRTVNASWRLAEARMWLEKLEVDEFLTNDKAGA